MKKNEHKIEVKLENKEWTKHLDATFKKKNNEVTIKGFRKGKAPKEKYLKEFGIESLFMDSVDAALPEAYKKALDDNKLEPVCEPKVDIKEIDDKHIVFEFTIITKPEVKVSSYKNLGVKKGKAKVTKKEIEDELISLQNRFAEIVDKEKGKVEDGNIAVIDFEGFVDGKPFEGGKGSDYPLEIGSGTFIPGFEEQLIGVKAGEEKDVKVKFPENYTKELANKDAVFKCKVKKIQERVLPKLNKEFYEDLGYDDVKNKEDLEKKIEEHLLEHLNEDLENKYLDELINAGIEKMTVDVNDEIIEDEINRIAREMEERLSMQGVTFKQYLEFTNSSIEKFKEDTKPNALARIKSRYLLDHIIEKEKLDATKAEVEKHAKEMASRYGVSDKELIDMYGGIEVVKYDLLVHKAIDVLKK